MILRILLLLLLFLTSTLSARFRSVATILTGLQSFMLDDQPTLGSLEASPAQRQRLARESLGSNVGDPLFCRYVGDSLSYYYYSSYY